MSKAELARRSGVSYDVINKLVRGDNKTTNPENAVKLAEALGFQLGSEVASTEADAPNGSRLVPVYDVSASAGNGATVDAYEAISHSLAFPPDYLKKLTRAKPSDLAIISVKGDSMTPTLNDDDIVMLDASKKNLSYDGLFVLQFGDALHVKRVTRSTAQGMITILSDNRTSYPPQEWPADEVTVIGKVIWVGGKV